MLPIVAIVGRPNVGKSTLFNRLIGGSPSLVGNEPGITRDRHYAEGEANGRTLVWVDTGGFLADSKTGVDAAIRDQVKLAIAEADLCLLVVDARTGLLAEEQELARLLRRAERPFLVVANKVDHETVEADAMQAHRLGAPVVAVSAEHGRNCAELTEAIAQALRDHPVESISQSPSREIRVALLGRPNAGKSSLINTLAGQQRVVVHEEPGTTRDPIDVRLELGGTRFCFVDTAGIRRHKHAAPQTEQVAMLRALRSLSAVDVCALVVDANVGLAVQDAHIADLVERAGRALVFVMNKWDLVQGSLEAAYENAREQLAKRLPSWAHAKVVCVSAHTGFGLTAFVDQLGQTDTEYHKRIPTGPLNRLLEEAIEQVAPPSPGGRPLRFYYITQVRAAPPTFVVSTNQPTEVPEATKRYLVRQIRAGHGFAGSPLRMQFRDHRPQ